MKWFLYFMSIYLVAVGVALVLYSELIRKFLQKLDNAMNIKLLFPLPLILGVLFILSKDLMLHPWFAIVLGAVVVAKGAFLLLTPAHYVAATINWWTNEAQDITYRFWGLIVLVVGITLLSWIT